MASDRNSHPLLSMLLTATALAAHSRAQTQEGFLQAPQPVNDEDRYGYDVAIQDDTLVVGAPNYNVGGVNNVGSVFVYERSGTDWALVQSLLSSDAALQDRFGHSIDIDGDRLAIGAWRNDPGLGTGRTGAVYVFERVGTTWSEVDKLVASDGIANQQFGLSLALDGDFLIVGAPTDFMPIPGQPGAAYVFERGASGWAETVKLVAPVATGAADLFGWSVDLDGARAVVGVPHYAGNAPGFVYGAAFLYERDTLGWNLVQELEPAHTPATELGNFGYAVALLGPDLAVGAPNWGENPFGSSFDPGRVYSYRHDGTSFQVGAELQPPGVDPQETFGRSVLLGSGVLAVGGPQGGTSGKVYVYDTTLSGWCLRDSFASQTTSTELFGWSLASSADSFAIGAVTHGPTVFLRFGAAYVYRVPLSPATSYCTGKTSSTGCVPFLATDGAPSATCADPFRIRAHDVLVGEAGFLLYGFQKANLSFHGGKLCIKAPVQRLLPPKVGKQVGGPPCGATLTRDFNKQVQSGGDPLLSVGQRVYAQWRQRDPADAAGFGDSLTNAVTFAIAP